MSRVIKFRAWDKEDKKMITPNSIDLHYITGVLDRLTVGKKGREV